MDCVHYLHLLPRLAIPFMPVVWLLHCITIWPVVPDCYCLLLLRLLYVVWLLWLLFGLIGLYLIVGYLDLYCQYLPVVTSSVGYCWLFGYCSSCTLYGLPDYLLPSHTLTLPPTIVVIYPCRLQLFPLLLVAFVVLCGCIYIAL